MNEYENENVIKGYVEALLWANAYHYVDPGNGEPESEHYGSAHHEFDLSDFSDEDQADIREQVSAFLESNEGDFLLYVETFSYKPWCHSVADAEELFGHDFLLTRSGHGAGFWDRGLGPIGDRLSDEAHHFGETNLYRGDDGLLYFA